MADADDNDVIFVGGKDAHAYANAVVHQMDAGHDVVTLRARGRAIQRAVDAAEIVRRDLRPGATVGRITIASEERVTDQGRPVQVSSIAIPLHVAGTTDDAGAPGSEDEGVAPEPEVIAEEDPRGTHGDEAPDGEADEVDDEVDDGS